MSSTRNHVSAHAMSLNQYHPSRQSKGRSRQRSTPERAVALDTNAPHTSTAPASSPPDNQQTYCSCCPWKHPSTRLSLQPIKYPLELAPRQRAKRSEASKVQYVSISTSISTSTAKLGIQYVHQECKYHRFLVALTHLSPFLLRGTSPRFSHHFDSPTNDGLHARDGSYIET